MHPLPSCCILRETIEGAQDKVDHISGSMGFLAGDVQGGSAGGVVGVETFSAAAEDCAGAASAAATALQTPLLLGCDAFDTPNGAAHRWNAAAGCEEMPRCGTKGKGVFC